METSGVANQKVREFLKDFIENKNTPPSAVLVTGPWGCGKTFLIKKFIEDHSGQPKFYYVSLYGISTREEFSEAVFFAIYPVLANKAVKIGGSLLASALKYCRIDTSLTLKKVLQKTERGVYVFDDLERASMPIGDLLGRINEFVEHTGCRVVVLADEEKLTAESDEASSNAYRLRKEKTIGWTMAVRCETEVGLTSFLGRVADADSKRILEDARTELLFAFQNSASENLRLLQQAIWDLERAIPKISKEFKTKGAFRTFISIAAVLAIETKVGRIRRSDLQDAAVYKLALAASAPGAGKDLDSPLEAFKKRHPGISLYDAFVRARPIHDWLFDGQIDDIALNAVFASDPRFADPSQIPSWQIAWDWRNSNDEVMTAIADMRQRLTDFNYRIDGEILHVFAILIDYAYRGWIEEKAANLLQQGKGYLDALVEKDQLELKWASLDSLTPRRGYQSMGFSGENRVEFKELVKHLATRAGEVLTKRAHGEIPTLLGLMEKSPQEFVRLLCPIGSNTGDLWRIPVLASIPAEEFAKKLLSIHPRSLVNLALVFAERYRLALQSTALDAEAAWLGELKQALKDASNASPPITQHQINYVIEQIDLGIDQLSKSKISNPDSDETIYQNLETDGAAVQ